MKYRHIDNETVERLKQEYGDVLIVETKTRAFVFKHPREAAFALLSRFLDKTMNGRVQEGSWELVSALLVYPEDGKEYLMKKPGVIPYLGGKIYAWLGGDEIPEEEAALSPFNRS